MELMDHVLWRPTPVFLLGESHGERKLAVYSPCGCNGLKVGHDWSDQARMHTHASSIFSFLRTLHNVFHGGCKNLLPQKQYMVVPLSLHCCQPLFLIFLKIAILTGVRWCFIVFLICILLIISDAEHFLYQLAICMSSLEKNSVYLEPLPIFSWIVY